jgi:GGDEF domain-containing protein
VPGALIILGLFRRDDIWPIAVSSLVAATGVVACSLRRDYWRGRSGPNDFAVLLRGTTADPQVAATRLTSTITELGSPDLGACAGIAALEAGTTAAETLRRAVLSLQTARSQGAGRVIRYSGTR